MFKQGLLIEHLTMGFGSQFCTELLCHLPVGSEQQDLKGDKSSMQCAPTGLPSHIRECVGYGVDTGCPFPEKWDSKRKPLT